MIRIMGTPSIGSVAPLLADDRRRSVQPMRLRMRPPGPANSLFRTMNSLFGQKEFPVFAGTGNWLQAIESAWRTAPKTAPTGRNRAKFPKIP